MTVEKHTNRQREEPRSERDRFPHDRDVIDPQPYPHGVNRSTFRIRITRTTRRVHPIATRQL